MVHVKCDFVGQQLRRFSLRDPEPGSPLSCKELVETLSQTYPALHLASRSIVITFFDDEGDQCLIEHDADLAEALRITPNLLRLKVSETFNIPAADDANSLACRAIETIGNSFSSGPYVHGVKENDRFDVMHVIGDCAIHECGDDFRTAATEILRHPPVFAYNVRSRNVARSLRLLFRQFVSKNGVVPPRDATAPLTFASSAVESFLVSAGTTLVSHGVTADRTLSVLRCFENAFKDKAIQSHLLASIPALQRQANRVRKQDISRRGPSPLQYLIKAATTSEVHASLSHFRDLLAEQPDDKPKLFLARRDLKNLTIRFLRENLKGVDDSPGKDDIDCFSREVSCILSRNAIGDKICSAAAEVAAAMVNDLDVRKAAFRIKDKHEGSGRSRAFL